jgi:hypothetical protein
MQRGSGWFLRGASQGLQIAWSEDTNSTNNLYDRKLRFARTLERTSGGDEGVSPGGCSCCCCGGGGEGEGLLEWSLESAGCIGELVDARRTSAVGLSGGSNFGERVSSSLGEDIWARALSR